MSLHPVVRPKVQKEVPSRDKTSASGEKPIALGSSKDVSELAKTLAAVGGGELSADLALDLVLNEVVQQAREASRATGAAIALTRDNEIVCRATSGNAPDLGVRVDGRSGLSGACLSWGQVQSCSDTETDPRVNANACRRLNVRSMLMVPILDAVGCFGILQVFAPEPNAFGENDIRALQLLAQKVAQSKKASEDPLIVQPAPAMVEETSAPDATPEITLTASPTIAQDSSEPTDLQLPEPRNNEVITSILVVLVIAAAILLGLVVGVRLELKGAKGGPQTQATKITGSSSPQASGPVAPDSSPQAKVPVQTKPAAPPVGGLIITDRGKVIYRSGPSDSVTGDPEHNASANPRGLIRRVEPAYPESAKAQHIEGPVVLDAQVLGDGTVGNIAIVRGHPLLAEAATEAVKQWKFEPSIVDGKPVDRQERITVRFTLPSS